MRGDDTTTNISTTTTTNDNKHLLLFQVAEAMAFVHANDVIHYDLKVNFEFESARKLTNALSRASRSSLLA